MLTKQILSNLLQNEDYLRKVIPFLKELYFQTRVESKLYTCIENYIQKYNHAPSKIALTIELDQIRGVSEEEFKDLKQLVDEVYLEGVDKQDTDWLVDQTEKFCKDRALYNGIMECVGILNGKEQRSPGEMPDILANALAVSFDNHIGHDFFDDATDRYEFYHHKENRIPFDLDYFNKITAGGLPNKTLSVVLAGTGVGKSLFMCHCAAAHLLKGFNVLYITMEMAEQKIAERIDANTLNVALDELKELPKETYMKRIEKAQSRSNGKLVIKEYPTASANSSHFRHLLNELRLKKKFRPDIIYIDYLNICASSRMKHGAGVNSYTYIKAIAEELRGLAVEYNVPIVTATQTTRSGFSNTDIGLEDTSESFGLPATADLMFALITTEELQALNQVMVKQLKNRHSDPTIYKKFVIGIDRSRMKLYDVEQSAQDDLIGEDQDDEPLFDRSKPISQKFQGFA
jgi:replicative DNA helicase